MPRTQIPVTPLTRTGVTPPAQTNADLTNLHVLVNDGSTWLEVVSTDAGAQTVSFTLATSSIDGVTVPPKTVPVAAGATLLIGPFPTSTYNQGTSSDGTITSDGTAPANNETVTIGSKTYTFKTALTGAANEVLIGASAAAALTNLKAAINAAAGIGTTYGTGTTANADVTAGTLTSTTLLVTAITAGTGGNSVATTETSAHLAWGAATLTGGYAPLSAVLIAPSVATTLKFRAYSVASS